MAPNPIDTLWGEQQPAVPCTPLRVHSEQLAGLSHETKLEQLRKTMREKQVDATMVTALDDVVRSEWFGYLCSAIPAV